MQNIPLPVLALFAVLTLAVIAVIVDRSRKPKRRYTVTRRPGKLEEAIMPELLGRPIGPTEIVSEKTGNRYYAPPGFSFGQCECSVRDPIKHEEGCPLYGCAIMPELRDRSVAVESREYSYDNLHRAYFGTNPGDELSLIRRRGEQFDHGVPDKSLPEVTSMPGVVIGRDGLARNEHDINERLAPTEFAECRMCGCPLPTHEDNCPQEIIEAMVHGEPLPPSMLHAPNIGSDDMPYAGRNYVEAEEIAEEMKGIRHFGTESGE